MNKFLKIAGFLLLGLVALVALLITALNVIPGLPLATDFAVDPAPVPIPDEVERIAHGRYLAHAVAVCGVCHGHNLAGQEMVNSPILGYIHTPNLTPGAGGVGQYYNDLDWVRALRHGIDPDGRGLIFMPTDYYYYLTDDDLGAVIAYLQSLPPVDNEAAATRLNPLTIAMLNAGQFGEVVRARAIDHQAPRPTPESDYGAYLLAIGGCTFCHGPDLKGGQGPEPGAPPAPNLTANGPWGNRTFDQFTHTMRTGVMPDGGRINPMYMPWAGYTQMRDEDLLAIWNYLQSLDS